MTIELTSEELTFLHNMLSGATVQGVEAMKILLGILAKLEPK